MIADLSESRIAPKENLPPPALLTAADVRRLDRDFANAPTAEVLSWAWRRFGTRAAIGTSFQSAGLVMIHLARQAGLNFPVFTLDTGLLFPETVELKKRLEDFFGIEIKPLQPDLSVAQQAEAHGPELWKRDPDLCCTMRKVLPLRDQLTDLDCWLTGLRRQQSVTRAAIGVVELYHFDDTSGKEIVKLNPVANWSRDDLWKYIQQHRIPYNPLHDQGYRSIGCIPCTRRAAGDPDERAGRWSGFKKAECGIHTFMSRNNGEQAS